MIKCSLCDNAVSELNIFRSKYDLSHEKLLQPAAETEDHNGGELLR